jgi:hypothetical protein
MEPTELNANRTALVFGDVSRSPAARAQSRTADRAMRRLRMQALV